MKLTKLEKQIVNLIKKAKKVYYKQRFYERVDRHKYFRDEVTNNDILTQDFIKAGLKKLVPDANFIGEEGSEKTKGRYTFVLDPIDGTANYKRDILIYGTQFAMLDGDATIFSIIYFPAQNTTYIANKFGAYFNGKPIYVSDVDTIDTSMVIINPNVTKSDSTIQAKIQLDLIRAYRSVRLFGCMAYNHALCASGRAECLAYFGNTPWDLLPGQFLIKQAGGEVYCNKKLNFYVMGNKNIVNKTIKKLKI